MLSRIGFRLSFLHSKNNFRVYYVLARKSSQKVSYILSKLDDDIKKDNNVNIPSILNNLQSVNSNWPELVSGQQLLGSVMHGLYHKHQHKDINLFVDSLLANGFNIWAGLSTTILKSYLEQKLWTQAIAWIDEMKKQGKLKHLRIYNDIIKSLARNDLLKLSYVYFQDVRNEEVSMRTSRFKTVSNDTLFELLQCVFRNTTNQATDNSDNYLKTPGVDTISIVHGVISYLHDRGKSIPRNILDIIYTLLSFENIGDVNLTSQRNLKCLYCGQDLIGNPNFSTLCNDIVLSLRDYMSQKGLYKEFGNLDEVLERHKYFDIIIDSENASYHNNKYDPGRLKSLLSSIRHLRPNKVVLLSQRKLPMPMLIDSFRQANISIFEVLDVVPVQGSYGSHVDLSLIYLAAKSELFLQQHKRTITLISNDKFNDHRFFAGKNQHDFFNWLNYRQKGVDRRGNIIDIESSNSVIYSFDGSLHLTSTDGCVCCIKPKS